MTAGKRFVQAEDVAALPRGSVLSLPADALITPLAQDLIRDRAIIVQRSEGGQPPQGTLAIGADHGGFLLKGILAPYIQALGYQVIDVGTTSESSVDYPDYAYAVANLVAQGRCQAGIIIDGAGIGSCMAANKVPGVRASLCYDLRTARNAREHNHANVLTLGAGLIPANLARQIVQTWLETPWGGGRHARRVAKIDAIESRFSRHKE